LEKNNKQYNMKNKKIIDDQKIETRKYISNVWPNYCMALLLNKQKVSLVIVFIQQHQTSMLLLSKYEIFSI